MNIDAADNSYLISAKDSLTLQSGLYCINWVHHPFPKSTGNTSPQEFSPYCTAPVTQTLVKPFIPLQINLMYPKNSYNPLQSLDEKVTWRRGLTPLRLSGQQIRYSKKTISRTKSLFFFHFCEFKFIPTTNTNAMDQQL